MFATKNTKAPETGEEWLKRQEPVVQDGILGKAAGKAYRSGEITLPDFVKPVQNEKWGDSLRAATFKEAQASAQVRAASVGGSGLPVPPVSPPPVNTVPPPPSDPVWSARVRQARAAQIAGYAAARGLTVPEYEKKVAEHLTELLDGLHVFRRDIAADARQIVGDGVFRSRFESGTTGGVGADEQRKRLESRLFGYPHEMPPAERPIYGYLTPSVDSQTTIPESPTTETLHFTLTKK